MLRKISSIWGPRENSILAFKNHFSQIRTLGDRKPSKITSPICYVMFLLGISENKATRKEFAIYRSNVVVPTGPGFFSLKTFCFAKMTSRVFNIVLEGSFQRSCYEPGSTMLKKRDVIEAKLKVWGDKKACAFGTTLLRKQNSPRHIIFRNSMQNIIFLSLEKVFQN